MSGIVVTELEDMLVKTDDNEPSVTVNSARDLTKLYNKKWERSENQDLDEYTTNVHNPFAGMTGPKFIIAVQNMTSAPLVMFFGNTAEPQIIEPEGRSGNDNNVCNEGNLTIGVCRVEYDIVKGKMVSKSIQSKYTIEYEALFANPVYVDDIGAFICIDKFRDWVSAYCRKKSIVTCVKPKRIGILTDYELRNTDEFIFSKDNHDCAEVRSRVYFNSRNSTEVQLFYTEDGKVRSTGKVLLASEDIPEDTIVIRDEYLDARGLIEKNEEIIPITDLIVKGIITTKSGRMISFNGPYLLKTLEMQQNPFTPPVPDNRVPVEDMDAMIEKATAALRYELEQSEEKHEIQKIANDKLKDSIKDRDTTIRHVNSKTVDGMSKIERIFSMVMTTLVTVFKGAEHVTSISKNLSERKSEPVQVVNSWAKMVTAVAAAGLSVLKLASAFA